MKSNIFLKHIITKSFLIDYLSISPLLDMEQWTGSKLGKECVKAVYCHPAYLTYMESTSCEVLG